MLRTLLHLSLALAARAVTWTNPLNTLNQPITGLTVTYDLSADGSGVDFTVTFTLAILMAMATICIGFTMLSDKATGNVLLQVDTYTPPRPAPAPTQGLRHRILS